MSSHTPGPWKQYVRETILVDQNPDLPESGKVEISVVPIHIPEGPQNIAFVKRDADARLVEAAPDLLEITNEILEGLAERCRECERRLSK